MANYNMVMGTIQLLALLPNSLSQKEVILVWQDVPGASVYYTFIDTIYRMQYDY